MIEEKREPVFVNAGIKKSKSHIGTTVTSVLVWFHSQPDVNTTHRVPRNTKNLIDEVSTYVRGTRNKNISQSPLKPQGSMEREMATERRMVHK